MFDININDYDYELKEQQIALTPAKNRDESNLLIFKNGNISHSKFCNITEYMLDNSLLVRNDTKVIPARMIFQKETGGIIELLLISPIEPSNDPQICMSAMHETIWECIVGGRNIRENSYLICNNLTAYVLSRYDNKARIRFTWVDNIPFGGVIKAVGNIPLPPYIKRNITESDKARYQTIYATNNGSVAAPTAGLHFSESTLLKLKEKNINTANITLHIGPGTFVPISTNVKHHTMHHEQIMVNIEEIQKILKQLQNKQPIVAVGTTSLRTLETLYWLGIKLHNTSVSLHDNLTLAQHEPYQCNNLLPAEQAISTLYEVMQQHNIAHITANTQLFIVPGYKIRTVDAIITNFHLPKSTLLLLVAAFVGENNWKNIYNAALTNNYKFLSYGDSSILFKCDYEK